MATLDDDYGYIDPSTVSPWSTAIKYGLIGGLFSVIFALITNMTGMSKPSAGMMSMLLVGIIGISIFIAVIVMAVKHHRDNELGGYISVGRVVLLGIIISLISGLIGFVFNYIYMNFIDPTYVETLLEEMEEMMAGYGLSEEQLEQVMADTADGFQFGKMLLNALLYSSIGGGVVSLIIGAIMSKKRDL